MEGRDCRKKKEGKRLVLLLFLELSFQNPIEFSTCDDKLWLSAIHFIIRIEFATNEFFPFSL
jgi:hypothetical protein